MLSTGARSVSPKHEENAARDAVDLSRHEPMQRDRGDQACNAFRSPQGNGGESIVRPLVTIIALGLIWLGAARMPASAKSRYVTAGVLSAVPFFGRQQHVASSSRPA